MVDDNKVHVIHGHRLENKKFTPAEAAISTRSEELYAQHGIPIRGEARRVVSELQTHGICISHIDFFNDDGMVEAFEKVKKYFNDLLHEPSIAQRIENLTKGVHPSQQIPTHRAMKKKYEINFN